MKSAAKLLTTLVAVAAVHAPQMASACSVCMGDPNSNIARGANAAIFLMLGLLGGVFSLLGGFGFYLYKQSKMPTPPHVELGDDINPQPTGGLK